jgi:hypothetical protein
MIIISSSKFDHIKQKMNIIALRCTFTRRSNIVKVVIVSPKKIDEHDYIKLFEKVKYSELKGRLLSPSNTPGHDKKKLT